MAFIAVTNRSRTFMTVSRCSGYKVGMALNLLSRTTKRTLHNSNVSNVLGFSHMKIAMWKDTVSDNGDLSICSTSAGMSVSSNNLKTTSG